MTPIEQVTQAQLLMQTAIGVAVANALVLGSAYVVGTAIKAFGEYHKVKLQTNAEREQGKLNREVAFERQKHEAKMADLENSSRAKYNA
jgi:uncharacterized protein YdgA (DUF945 family)